MLTEPIIEPASDFPMKSARAAFANLARLNLFNTLTFIEDAIGLKDPRRREDDMESMTILSMQNKSKYTEFRQNALRLFCRHFSFLKYMNEEDEKRKKKNKGDIKSFGYDQASLVLRRIIVVLGYYRDQSSHHAFRDERTSDSAYLETEERLVWELDTCFTIAVRVIKERFAKEFQADSTKTCLDFLNGRTRKDRNTRETVLNFRHAYSLAVKENGHTRLSELGKVFLLSLLLQKQYASELLDKCRAFEKTNWKTGALLAPSGSPQQSYIRDIFSALRIRLPHNRIDSNVGIVHIGLDMLGELKKCPDVLFELLSAEDRRRFEQTDSSTGETVLMRREKDRFPQLALSYIDYTHQFQSARFAVNVGMYRYVFKEKKLCIDGNIEPRILQKDLNGFGRIQEIEEIRTLNPESSDNPWPYQKLIKGYEDTPKKDADCCPYIRNTRTRYFFNGNHIGICFGPKPEGYPYDYASPLKNDDGLVWFLPDIQASAREGGHAEARCIDPHCWLSIFDIPAMAFLTFLTKDRAYQGLHPVERIILDCVIRYRKLFKDIADGTVFNTDGKTIEEHLKTFYKIDFKDVPKGLRLFLKKEGYDADALFRRHLLRILQGDSEEGSRGLIERSSNMLDKWEADKKTVRKAKENKAGKVGYVEIKTGVLMSWLLKDIVRLQKYMPVTDENGNTKSNKLTGLNYAKLQALLSTFPFRSSDELKGVFKAYGILDTHPFLAKAFVNYADNTPVAANPLALYENYLYERYEFFCDLEEKLLKGISIENYGFVKAERRRWKKDYLETLPKEFYDKETGRFIPVYLPSGLFEPHLRKQLERIPGMKDVLAAGDKNGRQANTTYMIQKYFEIVLHDGPQPYYEFERTYPFHEYIDKKRKDIKVSDIPAKNNATGVVLATSNLRRAVEASLRNRPRIDNKSAVREDRKGETNTPPTPYSVETLRKKWNEMSDAERTLRRYKVQDMLYFLMGISIVFPMDNATRRQGAMFLKNVMGGNEGTDILSQSVDITTSFRIQQKTYSIKQEGVKIRDYTEVFELLRDTRTRSLLPILPVGTVLVDDLRDELKRYDHQRILIFRDMLLLEKKNYERSIEDLHEGRIDFKRLLMFERNLSDTEKEQLCAIRNAFGHNYYANPESASYSPVLRHAPDPGPAEILGQKVHNMLNKS